MFYILSKTLGLIADPFIWIFSLTITGLFIKNHKTQKRIYLIVVILFFVFGNRIIQNVVFKTWEANPVKAENITGIYDYGIVLSGISWYDSKAGQINFIQSSDRIFQAVKLYKKGKIKKILITGGAAEFLRKDTVESVMIKNYLTSIGIPAKDIITEKISRNTHENAYYTAKLLQNYKYDKLLLITSAMHIKRANACFKKVGLNCDVFPVDYHSGDMQYNLFDFFIPSVQVLFYWNLYIHEILGLISYKISGYI